MKQPIAGPIVGGVLALVIAGVLLMFAVRGDSPETIYLGIMLALFVAAPLLIANVVMTAVYLWRKAPPRTYVMMWVPPILAMAILPVSEHLAYRKQQDFWAENPSIREMHVNLSGQSLWLDPEEAGDSSGGSGELAGDKPEQFVPLTRYPGGKDRMSAYTRARLQETYREMRIFRGHPGNTAPTLMPVSQTTAFPEVEIFRNLPRFMGKEAGIIEYWYYHYPDRVEVVPALSLSGSHDMDLWGSGLPVVDFHLANLGNLPIVRLEINGQAIALSDHAFFPETTENASCTSRNFSAHAITGLDQPLKVRWQLGEVSPPWHEATVPVRGFGPGPAQGRIRSTSVELYFQNDGSVVAEPSQLIDQPGKKLALRIHADAPPLRQAPPCGRVRERYAEWVQVIRE